MIQAPTPQELSKIKGIQALNNNFYNQVAEGFNESRKKIWNGQQEIFKYTSKGGSVIDLGCGNGRLIQALDPNTQYTGVDTNRLLLAKAADAHPKGNWNHSDIFSWIAEDTNTYSTGALLSVLHHFCHPAQLLTVLDWMYHHTGICVISRWNCILNDTLMNRRISLEDEYTTQLLLEYGLIQEQFGSMEFLFDWHNNPECIRYVKYWTDDELYPLLSQAGFEVIDQWLADGNQDSENTYIVLRPKQGITPQYEQHTP